MIPRPGRGPYHRGVNPMAGLPRSLGARVGVLIGLATMASGRLFDAAGAHGYLAQSFFSPIEGYDEVAAETPTAQTMSGLTVVSDTEFTVKLKAPTIDFVLRLAFTPFYPLPEAAFADMEAYGQNPIKVQIGCRKIAVLRVDRGSMSYHQHVSCGRRVRPGAPV